MCKAIDEVARVIADNELQLSWVAQQLGGRWSKHRLYYLLHSGKDISVTDYTELMRFFDKHGFTNPDKHGFTALDEVARLNNDSAALVSITIESMSDNKITPDEQADILLKLAKIEQRVDELRKLMSEGGK
mgnify:CR=1 FL=1